MNKKRHLEHLNNLLRRELGSSPLYQWHHSESPAWLHPVADLDTDGNVVYDYTCACGVNQSVHAPWCRSLLLPSARIREMSVFAIVNQSLAKDTWVMGAASPVDRGGYQTAWGTLNGYKPYLWEPVTWSEYNAATGYSSSAGIIRSLQIPSIKHTQLFIRTTLAYKEQVLRQHLAHPDAYRAAQERSDARSRKEKERARDEEFNKTVLLDELPLSSEPGKLREISFPIIPPKSTRSPHASHSY